MSGKATSVVLAGWYGATNLGDELLLSRFVDWVREAGGTPTVVSVHPAYTAAAYGVHVADYGDLASLVEALSQADLFVLGGGGLFQEYDVFDRPSLARFPARNVSQFAQFHYLARELGVASAVLGQGVGPLHGADARDIARQVFEEADFASVRDGESAQLLRRIGVERLVPIAPDPAWTIAPREPVRDLPERYPALVGHRLVAMIVRHWPFDATWEDDFAQAFDRALPPGWGCLWLDFTRTPSLDARRVDGSEIAHRLIPRLSAGRPHAVWQGMAIDEAMSLVAACDALVAMRLHGVLLGHVAGLPVVSLEYDEKVRVLGDELGMPAAQRMPLAAIADRLPSALRRVCGLDDEAPFRLSEAMREQVARNALAHRALLHDAMQAARRLARPQGMQPWLAQWSASCDANARGRIDDAVARRAARLLR
jgi:polysaccharide pyruvyl transferase CsaB